MAEIFWLIIVVVALGSVGTILLKGAKKARGLPKFLLTSWGIFFCFLAVIQLGFLTSRGIVALRSLPFSRSLDEYTSYYKFDAASGGHIKGKMVVIDKLFNRVDPVHFKIPKEWRATKPEEVETIVWVERSAEQCPGVWSDGAPALHNKCEITAIDKTRAVKTIYQVYESGCPIDGQLKSPQTMPWKNEFTSSSFGDSEIVDFIKGLPRAEE